MSELHVPLTTVDDVRPHPNADKLDIAVVKGWQTVTRKGALRAGDWVVYVPPDSVVGDEWADAFGIRYENEKGTITDYRKRGGRIGSVNLRGEPSIGFIVPAVKFNQALIGYTLEDNVAAAFGITKYVPPVRIYGGDEEPEHPLFTRYTDIENLRHMPDLFDGLELVITEKIHGANSRIGMIDGVAVAGSHRVQRKHPGRVQADAEFKAYEAALAAWEAKLPRWRRWLNNQFGYTPPRMWELGIDIPYRPSVYWKPFEIDGVSELLRALGTLYKQVILYGELYGPGIQALDYGVEQGQVAYVAFDLMLDGRYVEFDTFEALCRTFKAPMAPILATGTATFDDLRHMAEGETTLNGGPHLREGLVIRSRSGDRRIAKLISDSFLVSKGDISEDLSSDASLSE